MELIYKIFKSEQKKKLKDLEKKKKRTDTERDQLIELVKKHPELYPLISDVL